MGFFDEKFLSPVFKETEKAIQMLSGLNSPFVFVHDDLADRNGPVFNPVWYEKYIFSRYERLCNIVKSKGKKFIFVADGNMRKFFGDLLATGVDGVMLESSATDLDEILYCFDGKIVIGGIDTSILTFGTPKDVQEHTRTVCEKTKNFKGFAIASSGGLHGNIPLENLAAYFDSRVDYEFTPWDWQVYRCKH